MNKLGSFPPLEQLVKTTAETLVLGVISSAIFFGGYTCTLLNDLAKEESNMQSQIKDNERLSQELAKKQPQYIKLDNQNDLPIIGTIVNIISSGYDDPKSKPRQLVLELQVDKSSYSLSGELLHISVFDNGTATATGNTIEELRKQLKKGAKLWTYPQRSSTASQYSQTETDFSRTNTAGIRYPSNLHVFDPDTTRLELYFPSRCSHEVPKQLITKK
jgi:hypothetical protein